MDFDKFDKLVDQKKLQNEADPANDVEYDDVPKGTYIISIQRMEVKETNAKDKLMFSVQCKIVETLDASKKQDNRWIFFNRVIYGNRVTERWNDGRAIKGVLTWLEELTDVKLDFKSYSTFADDVEDLFEDVVKDKIEVQIKYDPEAFNPISIQEVFDI